MHRELGLLNESLEETINFTNSSAGPRESKYGGFGRGFQDDSESKMQKSELRQLRNVFDSDEESPSLPQTSKGSNIFRRSVARKIR